MFANQVWWITGASSGIGAALAEALAQKQAKLILSGRNVAALKDVATIRLSRVTPAIANHVPHLVIEWDEKRLRLTRARATAELAKGEPSIIIGRVSDTGERGILISVLTLQAGEEKQVAERLRGLLRGSER